MKRLVLFLMLLVMPMLSIVGCTALPQRLTLQPAIPAAAGESLANHQEIFLRVIDSRPENTLGYLEENNGKRQPFLSTRELDQVIDQAVSSGLRRRGFIPLAGVQDSKVSLTVEIQEFRHHVGPGILKVAVQTNISLKVTAVNGPRKLTGYYTVDKQATLVFRPEIQKNQQLVNEALDVVLEKVFQDQKLLTLLSTK